MVNHGPWRTHYKALHLLSSRGHPKKLEALLAYVRARLGPDRLKAMLNSAPLRSQGQGCVDRALACNMGCAEMLRAWGGTEQRRPPDSWYQCHKKRKGVRRSGDARNEERRREEWWSMAGAREAAGSWEQWAPRTEVPRDENNHQMGSTWAPGASWAVGGAPESQWKGWD